MQPVPFKQLLWWIVSEYHQQQTIFGIPAANFFRPKNSLILELQGANCSVPLGPAAGPHTQLAQNIVAAYLCGARYFELKTVQVFDQLDIAKPCIDAASEGYNTEWSTELSISQAGDEYLKAWLIIHFLQAFLQLPEPIGSGFIFNMSVGYDLTGIRSEKVDQFIEYLKDARHNPNFGKYLQTLKQFVDDLGTKQNRPIVLKTDQISPHVADSVTLSTMHGCPPHEIAAIARYLIAEKGLHTYIKLNPTLLGLPKVRKLLDANGYKAIRLMSESFENDLQYDDALQLIHDLQKFAQQKQRGFGLKLSNTLPVVNEKGYLPGKEMYLSGAALFPLTINLATQLACDLKGAVTISYSGGATADTVRNILATGIAPVTVATDLLKPGGYLRLNQMAAAVETLPNISTTAIDVAALERLAAQFRHRKVSFALCSTENRKLANALPLWDCFISPCQAHCPINQNVPYYLHLLKEGEVAAALRIILKKNPLPHITGYICDHQCELKCVRNFYESPLAIRALKRCAAEAALEQVLPEIKPVHQMREIKVAVIGAGPAGLATAFFLAREGLEITIFDSNAQPGGTVRYLIPRFRLPQSAIESDLELLRRLNVDFRGGTFIKGDLKELQKQGFQYVVVAIGANRANHLTVPGAEGVQIEALDFLRQFNQDSHEIKIGPRVVVIGGGNSAMDAARAALRIKGVQKVSIIYRRTLELMPADHEELENALQEGAELRELLQPVKYRDGHLICQQMRLSEPDASGRARPVPIENAFVTIPSDTIITAIGEAVESDFLKETGFSCEADGRIKTAPETLETDLPDIFACGDARRGPATVVEAIADAQLVAAEISRRVGIKLEAESEDFSSSAAQFDQLQKQRGNIQKIIADEAGAILPSEGKRCLQCQALCGRCVEVCPNRANVLLPISSSNFRDAYQIVHLDALCNSCGNCATFCPYLGKPYEEKFTIYQNADSFQKKSADGVLLLDDGTIQIKVQSSIGIFPDFITLQTDPKIDDKTKVVVKTLITDRRFLF